jgi:predicted TPR repeat methyltransferase
MAGIDLSSGMLDKAKERQIYQGLYQGDLIEVLVQQHEQLGEG